ncbi:MAG: hypothetical protein ACPIOQ_09790 [Promethearchaeia archaeon]
MAGDLSAQGSGLRAPREALMRQKTSLRCLHLTVYIVCLAGDDDICYYIGERPELEGETENSGV